MNYDSHYDFNHFNAFFKFHFDTKTAYVALCIDMNPIKQQAYWDQMLAHKSILETDFLPNVIFGPLFELSELIS